MRSVKKIAPNTVSRYYTTCTRDDLSQAEELQHHARPTQQTHHQHQYI